MLKVISRKIVKKTLELIKKMTEYEGDDDDDGEEEEEASIAETTPEE